MFEVLLLIRLLLVAQWQNRALVIWCRPLTDKRHRTIPLEVRDGSNGKHPRLKDGVGGGLLTGNEVRWGERVLLLNLGEVVLRFLVQDDLAHGM